MSASRPSPLGFGPHTTASELGRLSECEMRVMLELYDGDPDADAPHRTSGREEHRRFELAAAAHHDRGRSAALAAQRRGEPHGASGQPRADRVSPCFIASAVYGPRAEETEQLRRFRDRVLLRHRPTAALVAAYYRLSPPIARALSHRPTLAAVVRRCLDGLRRSLPTSWTSPS